MTDFTHTWRPSWGQHDAWEAAKDWASYIWLCGGLGAGKTFALVFWAFMMATHYCRGIRGMIVEPDFQTFGQVFMAEWKERVPDELWEIRRDKYGEKLVVFWGDGRQSGETEILIRSAMNAQVVERINGPNLGWAGLDEPGRMKMGKMAYDYTLGRLRLPTPMGRQPLFIVGSPRGFNWLAKAFDLTEDHPPHAWTQGYVPKDGYFVRAVKTADNVANDPNFVERLIEAYGEAYAAQELEGRLRSMEGAIFPGWYRSVHVIPHDVAMALWPRVTRKRGGMDFGFTNPATVYPAGQLPDDELLIIDEWYKRNQQIEEWHTPSGEYREGQASAALRFRDEYGPTVYECDPSRPEYILKLRSLGIEAVKANNDWETGCDELRSRMNIRFGVDHPVHGAVGCPRLLVSDRCTNLISEMGSYIQKEVRPGQPLREGAQGEDHGIDAVRYIAQHFRVDWSIAMR